MASFLIRVQLLKTAACDQSYAKLHHEMAARNCLRTVTSTKTGKSYNLSRGTYRFVGAVTVETVIAKAKASAAATGCGARNMVTEYTKARWSGLAGGPRKG